MMRTSSQQAFMCLDWHWLPPLICVRSLGFVREVGPHLSLLKNNFKRHALHCEKKNERADRPRRSQPKKWLIQHHVFHAAVDTSENLNFVAADKNHNGMDE
jgi:hypothetical protein